MLFECGAIILVIFITSIMLFRSERGNGFALGVLPLILVPAAHMLGRKLSIPLAFMFPFNFTTAYIIIDVTALMTTCLLLGGISMNIHKKSTRVAYLCICGGFAAALTCVLLVRSVLS